MKKVSLFFIFLTSLVLLWGCNEGANSSSQGSSSTSSSTSAVVRGTYKNTQSHSGSLSAMPSIASLDDVAKITVTVKHGETSIINEQELVKTHTTWETVLENLPTSTMLSFEAKGFDASNDVVVSGTTLKTLVGDGSDIVTVALGSDVGIELFSVKAIRYPQEIQVLDTQQVQIDLTVVENDPIDYQVTAADGGGSFAIDSGIYLPASTGIATLTLDYTAPAVDGNYRHSIRIKNSSNTTVRTGFITAVAAETNQSNFSVVFNPYVTAFEVGERDGGNVPLSITAGDDQPVEQLTYHWTFDSGGQFPNVGFADNTLAQVVMTNYEDSVSGTIVVEIKDADDGTTTVTIPVAENQFLDVIDNQNNSTVNANAGLDASTDIGVLVNLDGSASTTSSGALSYTWSIMSAPAGSTATLDSTDTVTSSFTPDVAGVYNIRLRVTNGEKSDSANVLITANRTRPALELESIGGTLYRLNLLSPPEYQDNRLSSISGIRLTCSNIGDNVGTISGYHNYVITPTAFGDIASLSMLDDANVNPNAVGASIDILSLSCDAPPVFDLDANSAIGYALEPIISGAANIDVINP